MKTKREVLESIVKIGSCKDIECTDCPYDGIRCHDIFFKIGAMAILRQNRKKREFDPDKILTCVTAGQAKVGMKGYFADNIESLRYCFRKKQVRELLEVYGEKSLYCFKGGHQDFALFYPIDEVEE